MSMSTQAIDMAEALADAIRPAPAFAGVLVLDGPAMSGQYATDTIAIGVPPPSEAATPAMQVSRVGPGGLTLNDFESITLTNAIAIANGAADHRAARRRASELHNEVGALLTADPTLGGAVMLSMLGNWTLWTLASSGGAEVLLAFDVLGRSQL